MGGRAVGIDWGGRLQVTHFDEGRANGNNLLVIEEDRSSFGIHGKNQDSADGPTLGEDQSVSSGIRPDVRRWRIVAQVEVACSATVRIGLNKIRRITDNIKAYVTIVEPDGAVWLRDSVVHHHLLFLDGVGGV